MTLLAWLALPLGMKALWIVAIVASIIFVVQTVMIFTDDDEDAVTDVLNGDGNLLAFRNLFIFVAGAGWSFIIMSDLLKPMWNGIFSVLFGLIFVVLMSGIFYSLIKMQRARTVKHRAEVVGYKGKVLVPVPSANQGKGRVWVSVKGVVSEYDAITLGEDELAEGVSIIVLNLVDDRTLEVKRIRLVSDIDA
ncbi:MAG: hypothetical protein K5651_08305 [Bacteroidales bacterium]|nr:hypothetical protein [Bacteroidales bacterium]